MVKTIWGNNMRNIRSYDRNIHRIPNRCKPQNCLKRIKNHFCNLGVRQKTKQNKKTALTMYYNFCGKR